MLKFLKKIKPIYIILGLFVVVIIVSALGSKTTEGMTNSTNEMTLKDYELEEAVVMKNIETFVFAQDPSWDSDSIFLKNISDYLRKIAYVDNSSNTAFIAAMTELTGNSIPITQSDVDAAKAVLDKQIALLTNTDDQKSIDNYISKLVSINNSRIPLLDFSLNESNTTTATGTNTTTVSNPTTTTVSNPTTGSTSIPTDTQHTTTNEHLFVSFNFDGVDLGSDIGSDVPACLPGTSLQPNNLCCKYNYEYTPSADGKRATCVPIMNRPVSNNQDFPGFEQGYIRGYDSASREYRQKRHRDRDDYFNTKPTTSTSPLVSPNDWKQLYLNSLITKPKTTTSLSTPTYGSLLNNNSILLDTGDASSGTGVGVGKSTAGAGTSASKSKIIDTASYNISQGPVQQGAGISGAGTSGAGTSGAGTSGAGKTSDAYLLNNSQTASGNCPVGGCSTSGSSPNNCKPAPVPPCPPCERCPEASFDCKRVPKYNSAANNQYMPQPVLSDFSQFGM